MPRAKRFSIMMLCACCCLSASAAYAAPQKAEELARTEAQLKARAAEAKRLESERAENARTLSSLRSRATTLAAAVQRSEANLSASELKLTRLTAEVNSRTAELSAREADMRQAMVAMINLERMPMVALFAQGNTANTTLRTAAALSMARESLAKQSETLRKDVAALTAARNKLGRVQTEAQRLSSRLMEQRNSLLRDIEARSSLESKLQQDSAATRAEIAALTQKSKSLKELINNLEKQSPAQPTRGDIRNFGGMGSLKQPVSGSVVHRFGEHKNANDTYRGMVLRARQGAVVVAPYDGEVAFTGPFMDYGPMVLIRHKNGYISLLAGLAHTQVQRGQTVRSGEPIGLMGNRAAENLYVELRQNSKPIDPARWFATVTTKLANKS